MVSKTDLKKLLREFQIKYLNPSKNIHQDKELLHNIDASACALLDSFLKYYDEHPEEFNYFRKYFLNEAMTVLKYTKFFYLFYHNLNEPFKSKEEDWSEESLEKFKSELCADYSVHEFNTELINIKKYLQ